MEESKLSKRKKKAEKDNNKEVLIATCADLADIYIKCGNFNSAIKEYQTVADIYKSENNNIEYARVNRGIGEAYMGLHDFEKALQHFKTYLDIAFEEKCEIEKQRAFATIGHAYLTCYLETQNNPETNLNLAYKYFMKSLVIAEKLTGITKLESADMIARLFSNLGLVKDSLEEYDMALSLFERSITICKQNDIYEQLSRGYQSIASLYEKKKDYNTAIQYYNLAVDAAKKLKNNVQLVCSGLQGKADILIKISDFHGAKQVLLKAYKLKIPIIQERKNIEHNLKAVAAMCYTEDKLVVSSGDNKEMKKLYEIMGDAACQLKNFSKAIEYYKLMLEYAQKSGINDQDLASCYYSIAETYKDNEQYEEAVEYFEKELAFYTTLQDYLNTLSKIAYTKESAEKPVEEVKSVYEIAFAKCRQENNLKEERRMVNNCINYLRRNGHHTDAFRLEQYLESLNCPIFDSDSSSSDQENENSEFQMVIDKINLSEITDNSENSDIENQTSPTTTESAVGRRRHRSFAVKKNAKGESQLHVACINGRLKVVTHLLEQGHPVNVRDNSGWLPLHEACNYGYLDIVKVLLDRGAAINDRGGSLCNGVTPLYDAANNGHVKIVQLLLDKGASPLAKTDDGDTALQVLKRWHCKTPFEGEDLLLYNSLVTRMTDIMEKVGQKVETNSFRKTPSFEHINSQSTGDDTNIHQNIRKKNSFRATQAEHRSRKFMERDRNDSIFVDSTSNEISSEDEGVGEYQKVMNILKRKTTDTNPNKQRNIEKKSAFVVPDHELLDDWLEDDLATTKPSKKRKINPPGLEREMNSLTNTSRNSLSPSKRIPTGKRASDDLIIPNNFFDDDFDDNETLTFDITSPAKKNTFPEQSKKTKRANQVSLLDAGFSRHKSGTPPISETTTNRNKNNSLGRKSSFEFEKQKQQKLTSFGLTRTYTEPDSTTQGNQDTEDLVLLTPDAAHHSMPSTGELMLFVDINIDGKVFRIPVMTTQVQRNTIGWLADQAAYKYARKEGTTPTLELETNSGALLSDEDPLSLLFPLGVVQAEPIIGRIVHLSLPSIVERYKAACLQMETGSDENLCAKLEEMSVSLNLNNNGFLSKSLSPLCRALNHQTTLFELDLSGNLLDADCVKKLCATLPSLINLSSLNLRCTGLICSHIVDLVNMFTSSPVPILQNLFTLNLSDNYLEDKSLYHISQITRHLKLTNFLLSNVKFSKSIFRLSCNENVDLKLDNLLSFDISDNELDASSIRRFIQHIDSCKIKELNIARNNVGHEGIMNYLIEWLKENEGGGFLENLNVSRSGVQENELYELLGSSRLTSFKIINLSYNSNLTGISLRRLLEYSALQQIILIGCDNILKYFDDDYENCDLLWNNEATSNKFLEISGNLEEYSTQVKTLVKLFENKYPEYYIEQDSRFLLLSSKPLDKIESQ